MGDIPRVSVPVGRGGPDAERTDVADAMLAIDPGRGKCGLAVGHAGPGGRVLARAVVSSDRLPETVRDWVRKFRVIRILIGNRTGAREIKGILAGVSELPLVDVVEEEGTTLEARRRYFRDHPPRGWRRLIPLSMQIPPEPYDDYVALLLLERTPAGGKIS